MGSMEPLALCSSVSPAWQTVHLLCGDDIADTDLVLQRAVFMRGCALCDHITRETPLCALSGRGLLAARPILGG
jgi:hypothetical protein